MARMIPELTDEQILAAHDSEAEARVYRSLRDQLSDEVTVKYSVSAKMPTGRFRQNSESK